MGWIGEFCLFVCVCVCALCLCVILGVCACTVQHVYVRVCWGTTRWSKATDIYGFWLGYIKTEKEHG